jgi:hypothetical protein
VAEVGLRRGRELALVCSLYVRCNYEQIKARKGAADARVVTGRKLAELTWKIWKEGRCYEDP